MEVDRASEVPERLHADRAGPGRHREPVLLRTARRRAHDRRRAEQRLPVLQRRACARRLRARHQQPQRVRQGCRLRLALPGGAPPVLPGDGRGGPPRGRQDLRAALVLLGGDRLVAAADAAAAGADAVAGTALHELLLEPRAATRRGEGIRRRLPPVGGQPAPRGLRRRRGARLARHPARAVHVAVLQPADRRVRRQPREPAAPRVRVPRGRTRRRPGTGWPSACASTATSCCPAATGCRRPPRLLDGDLHVGARRLRRSRRRRRADAVLARHAVGLRRQAPVQAVRRGDARRGRRRAGAERPRPADVDRGGRGDRSSRASATWWARRAR